MKRSKLTLVLLFLAGATVAWTIRHGQLRQTRRAIAEAESQVNVVEARHRTAQEEWSATQTRLAAEKQGRQQALAEVAQAARELAKFDPESLWASPPDALPEWNAESPYVWLRKEIISKLPVEAFLASGELRPEIAQVFTLEASRQAALNAALQRCLDEYRKVEAAQVERLEEHLPSVADQKGDKLTIRIKPLPAEATKARQEFEAALRQELGDQRTDLLLQVSDGWLSSEFGQSETESPPKTISVVRYPDGNLFVSIQSGWSTQSMGVDRKHLEVMNEYLPPHLLPFFQEFLEHQGEAGTPAAAPP